MDPKRGGTLKGELCYSTGTITYPATTPGHAKEIMLKCSIADRTGSITVLCYKEKLFTAIQDEATKGYTLKMAGFRIVICDISKSYVYHICYTC